ncbi:MAG: hypothetical protein E3J66_01550 [Dehalococcoidia bacterium]|nr:MAG: hypothetical protein E3J66_01550 [Dehalococcoidia bacterium]
MTPDEAINKLKESLTAFVYMDKDEKKAIQLGIEALGLVKKVRNMSPEVGRELAYLACLELLPSETKEKEG